MNSPDFNSTLNPPDFNREVVTFGGYLKCAVFIGTLVAVLDKFFTEISTLAIVNLMFITIHAILTD